jgi:tetratricopeptide (TPR) repeat protein
MKLGRYTVVGRLGAGAMAEVHAARLDGPGGFSRRVAIKRIRPHLVKHPGIHEMLVTEGRLAAVLEHTSILQVYELLDEGGEFGLVMEYADAGSLQRLIEAARASKKPIPWPVVAAIGAEVAGALAYAHQLTDMRGTPMGVVHRDVSPSNILLTSSGGVKLADFGIAAARGALSRGFAGEVPGKTAYMPREQALGLPSSDRVDVFALGAVLYELLTLEQAWPRGHQAALDAGERPRPLADARPDAPPALRDVIERAMAMQPEERPTAALMAVVLRKVQEPVAGELAAGGLARFLMQHLPPVQPEPAENVQEVPTHVELAAVVRSRPRLIGREEDSEAILERFGAGARAVTLVGAPGMGKTALAQHFVLAGHPRWVRHWFVALQDVAPPWGLALAMSRVLDVPLDTGGTPAAALERLGEVLHSRSREGRALLVLDGTEAFGAALRQVVPRWLDRAPGLELLLTSSERPGFGEALVVGPLATDDAVDVLRQQLPGGISGVDDAALHRLAARLDGVPLALKLAAAALQDTPLPALEAKLASGASLAPTSTLDETLGAVLARLDEAEHLALAQLAIFVGGFTLPAAQAVVALPPGAPALEVLVDRLRQRSLVRRLPGEAERLGLYEVLRAWGLAFLESRGELAAVRGRHTGYFLREGARWAAGASGRMARTLCDTILGELQNLLAVHQRAVDAKPPTAVDAANALVVALVLEPALSLRGPHGLLLSLLDSALSLSAAHAVPPPLQVRAELARGTLLRELGRLNDAESDLESGLAMACALSDLTLEAFGLSARAALRTEQARYDEATADLARAGQLAETRGDRRLAAIVCGQRALLALERGQLDEALAGYRDTMQRLATLGDTRLEALASGHLGTLHLELGRTEDARECYALTLSLLSGSGDVRSFAMFTGYRALADFLEGDLSAATQGLTEATRELGAIGEVRFAALFEACLGAALARQDQLTLAERHLDAAEARLHELGDTVFLAAVAVHRLHLGVARGAPVPFPPGGPPEKDNDVRLAWRLLETARRPDAR